MLATSRQFRSYFDPGIDVKIASLDVMKGLHLSAYAIHVVRKRSDANSALPSSDETTRMLGQRQ